MSVSEKLNLINEEVETQEELIAQIQNVLKTKGSGGGGGEWTRPTEWLTLPNDCFNEDFEGLYMLIEPSLTPRYFGVTVTCSTGYRVEMCHTDSAGNVTVLRQSAVIKSATKYADIVNDEYGYCYARIVPEGSGHITLFTTSTYSSVIGNYAILEVMHGVELVGRLPYTTKISNWSSSYNNICSNLIHFDVRDCVSLTSLANLFNYSYFLEKCSFIGWDTSKVLNFSYMFRGCKIKEIDISNFSADSATNMSYMFYDCQGLRKLTLPKWNTSLVTTFGSMFQNCYCLEQVNADGWVTEACTNISSMFQNCIKAKLSFRNWDTKSVKTFNLAFSSCRGIQELDYSGFDLTSCTTLNSISSDVYQAVKYDCSGWQVPSTADISYLFRNIYSCQEINLDNTTFTGVKLTNMFYSGVGTVERVSLSNGGKFNTDLSISNLTNIDKDSLLGFLNSLLPVTTTTTITLGTTLKAKLTADELKIATDKGWTVA